MPGSVDVDNGDDAAAAAFHATPHSRAAKGKASFCRDLPRYEFKIEEAIYLSSMLCTFPSTIEPTQYRKHVSSTSNTTGNTTPGFPPQCCSEAYSHRSPPTRLGSLNGTPLRSRPPGSHRLLHAMAAIYSDICCHHGWIDISNLQLSETVIFGGVKHIVCSPHKSRSKTNTRR